jgi:hypothetical protein
MLASLQTSLGPDAEQRTRIAAMLAEAAQCAEELGLVDVATCAARVRAKLERLEASAARRDERAVLRNEGDVWTVRYGGSEFRLKDGKGPRYLATLLDAPGREVHVLDFVAPAADPRPGARDGLSIRVADESLDDAPDARARREYHARLADLRAEIEEAERFADHGRVELLRGELDQLVRQLAVRFGTRAQRRGPAETARKAVTKVLRTQIGKLLDLHPALGRHLRHSVRMGTKCVYAPATPVAWDVVFAPK